MKQTDFAKALTKFLSQYLPGERNVSPNTIKSYRDTFKQLLFFCRVELKINSEYLTFKDLESNKIRSFLVWLEKTRKASINTRNQRLAAIHSFYRYTQSENPEIMFECQKILGISFKKREIKPIEYLTQDSLKILFLKPDTKKSKERRNLIIMVLLYDAGAKVQELIDLKVRDVRLAEPATITLIGKGKKNRHVPIMGKTCDLLKQYMDESHLCDNGKQNQPLFSSSNNKPFSRPGITYILAKTLAKARESNPQRIFPKKLTPHMLRHTKAVHLLEAGII
ncbi:MAG: tyrosine-type recombinase/integrase [Alkaliphilus sp.]